MFRTLIYPSSGACDYSVELPHWSYCSWFDVLEFQCGWVGVVSVLQTASGWNTDTTPIQPHRNSNTHWTKNNTTNVVIQQNSCKLLMMDTLMSETCWAHKKWNNIASDIKLVFYSLRCDLFSLLHFCSQLYMFRVLTPIIRSSYNCNYSFWYWLTAMNKVRYYQYHYII